MNYSALRSEILSARPDIDISEVDRAYEFSKKAHGDQKRYSGEDYIAHPVEAARILMDLDPDLSSIQACLLHDVTEDTDVKIGTIEKTFGKDVAALVNAMEKMAVIKVKKEDQQMENWKKMFLAMAKDIRVVFIKLSDRLHNMRTLEFVPKHKQERIARETLFVHAAIASRLGIYKIKSEMEDLCFKYLCPEPFAELSAAVSKFSKESDEDMAFATSQIEQLLVREGVNVKEVSGRRKHLWSVYQKMSKKQALKVEDIYDLFAVRVILPDSYKDGKEQVSHLYTALGVIHNNFVPLQDRFKDYIAVPKPNGYRSLHTTVLGVGADLYSMPTEIQIRTAGMHAEAELGVASHWAYKENKKIFKKHLTWFRGLADDLGDKKHRLEIDIFPDKIFVLSPKGDVMELARGSTPLDFAYLIHTDVGNCCSAAKVNAKVVPLDYELKNGEMVEIVTRINAKPGKYWLSMAKTSNAKAKIKAWFHKQEFESNIKLGRDMLNKELALMKKPKLDEKYTLLKNYAGKARDMDGRLEILEAVGLGMVTSGHVARTLFAVEEPHEDEKETYFAPELTGKVLISGEQNLPLVLSACCKPKPPAPIIAYVTRGQSIRVHKANCRELKGLEGDRFISAVWE